MGIAYQGVDVSVVIGTDGVAESFIVLLVVPEDIAGKILAIVRIDGWSAAPVMGKEIVMHQHLGIPDGIEAGSARRSQVPDKGVVSQLARAGIDVNGAGAFS